MFSHVMVGSNDLEASRKFYDAVLNTLGIPPGVFNNGTRYFYRTSKGSFSITQPIDGQPATHANGGTIGFLAEISPFTLVHKRGCSFLATKRKRQVHVNLERI